MFRTVFTAALAGAAITIATPAIAQKSPGGAPNSAAIGARVNSQGPANASATGILNASPNSVLKTNPVTTTVPSTVSTTTRVNATKSQGPANASVNGIAHASPNSVLARGAVAATALPGLTTGLTVNNSAGTLGTVSQVITGTDGSIRAVVVTNAQGQTIRLPANTLTISGGVVTTTSATTF